MRKMLLIAVVVFAALFGGHATAANASCSNYFSYLDPTPSSMIGRGYLSCGLDYGVVVMRVADLTTGQWSPDAVYGNGNVFVGLSGTWGSGAIPLKCGHRYQAYMIWDNHYTKVYNNHANSTVQTYLC